MNDSGRNRENGLNVEKVLAIIGSNGLLSRCLPGFEPREQQKRMMGNILEAYNNQGIALIEAGTGTGKSIAYLIPAMLWAVQEKERTLISTNTITLQEQLLHKDIPLLAKVLNVDIKTVLVKGMNNYVCLRKLSEAQQELCLMSKEEAAEVERVLQWKPTAREGSRSELAFTPKASVWEKVSAENDLCSRQDCPFYQECFFFRARREAEDAQILIANHHLLFADLICRAETGNYKDSAVLPAYSRIILDEAHHIEDVATGFLASHVTRIDIMRILKLLAGEKQGKLSLLKQKIQNVYKKTPPTIITTLLQQLSMDFLAIRNDILQQTVDTFEAFEAFVNLLLPSQSDESVTVEGPSRLSQKLRLLPMHQTHPDWSTKIIPNVQQLMNSIQHYVQRVDSLEKNLKDLKDEQLNEKTKAIRFDISALLKRLASMGEVLGDFMKEKVSLLTVRWIEAHLLNYLTNIHLIAAQLDVSKSLVDLLFSKFSTIVLCSATLTTNRQFDFIRHRLGITSQLLPKRRVTENIYESPFDYQKQVLLAIPTDLPDPSHPQFITEAVETIWQAIQASQGNAFILFTSYSMLTTCHQQLEKRLNDHKYPILKQGDGHRKSLLSQFKNTNRSVLFATDSFWEGVDVAGDALRCVIIVKLPFKVPSEPINQARMEAISAKGGDSFFDYALPTAIVKFKQGFGRLIRNKNDRGCIVCLDSRLIKKNYGKQFINSLPSCQQSFVEVNLMKNQMIEFYRKTYHLVKKQQPN